MVCKACTETLHRWKNGKKSLNFEITMVWRRPTNYVTDCYFCSVDFTWINIMNLSSLKYPDLQLARHPIVYYDEILVPIFRQLPDINIVSCFNEQKEEVFLRWSSTSIFPKKIELSSLQPQLVKGISNCWHLDWRKKNLWHRSYSALKKELVLCRFWSAYAQAWGLLYNRRFQKLPKKRKFKPWNLNNGDASWNLHLLTFINLHYLVYSNWHFHQVIINIVRKYFFLKTST